MLRLVGEAGEAGEVRSAVKDFITSVHHFQLPTTSLWLYAEIPHVPRNPLQLLLLLLNLTGFRRSKNLLLKFISKSTH